MSGGKSKSLAELLEEHKQYISLSETGLRIKCLITAHEMPPRADAVQAYLDGAKFRKAREWYSQDYSHHEPFLVQDKKNPTRLFCKITRTRVNKIPADVEKHVTGKRFLRLKQNYLEREARRAEQPSDDESGEEGGDGGDVFDDDEQQSENEQEDDEEEIDVEKEAAEAAAAGVWMPKEELKAVVDAIKTKKIPGGRGKALPQEEEEEEEEEEGEGEGAEEESIASDDSDADLRYYIRSEPEPRQTKAKPKHKGGKGGKSGKGAAAAAAAPADAKPKLKRGAGGQGKQQAPSKKARSEGR